METMSFSARLKLAWSVLVDAVFAAQVEAGLKALDAEKTRAALPPERVHASGLSVLAALQREGRLLDFLQQDVTSFSDDDVGAAARVVHAGCRKLLQQSLDLQPAVKGEEGGSITVPEGFDAQRVRLTGRVAGRPPFRGTLKHHGWVAATVRLPTVAESLDPRVLAAAEVELE